MLVDDISLVENGLTPVDAWTPNATSGYLSIEGADDSGSAQDGVGYLVLENGSSADDTAYLDGSYKPVVGTVHEMSVWLRARGPMRPQITCTGRHAEGSRTRGLRHGIWAA